MDYKNFFKLQRFSLLYDYYYFIDVADYLADKLFIQHRVNVKFQQEMQKHGCRYLIMFCRIKKRDRLRLEAALGELKNKMLLLGYADYEEFCKKIQKSILEINGKSY